MIDPRAMILENADTASVLENPFFILLAAKLLAIREAPIFPQFDHYVQRLLIEGRVFDYPVRLEPMSNHGCHASASSLWNQKGYSLCTGWAWAERAGQWHLHSWCLDGTTLVEPSPRPRGLYYGIVLAEGDALDWWGRNSQENAAKEWRANLMKERVANMGKGFYSDTD